MPKIRRDFVSPQLDRERAVARPIAGGLVDSRHGLLLDPGQAVEAVNVDLDRESVRVTGGAVKLGNQVAPRSALLFGGGGTDVGLEVLPGKSAPARGGVMVPWNRNQDIGAELNRSLADYSPDPELPVYHAQRGKSFDIQGSFQVPADERIFTGGEEGQLTTLSTAAFETTIGAEIALDEFTAFMQKGGDGMAPMSWAVGMVNTGRLFDIDVDGAGHNIFGGGVEDYADRDSNYALCFMWLDAPGVGDVFPVQMRYHLQTGQTVWSDDGTHVGTEFGSYCTMAYRAFIVPLFVVPGRTYDVSVSLKLDTGSAGESDKPVTSWNDDGVIRVAAIEEGSALVQTWTADAGGSNGILRYKGPADSLEYLMKYGVRWHGRDPHWFGLGYRFAPWAAAGFMPFGIDSAPIENGGFRLTDPSVHWAAAYGESLNPEDSASPGTIGYFLRIAHDNVKDTTGLLLEVSDQGLVHNPVYVPANWGAVAAWAGVSPCGRSPWAGRYGTPGFRPFAELWRGLGGDRNNFQWGGHNPEALRGYRVVLAPVGTGLAFDAAGASGGLLSIESYVASGAYATPTHAWHLTLETGWANGAGPTFTGNDYRAFIRAFRWNQRRVVLSDWRIYSAPRDYTSTLNPPAGLSLRRMSDPSDVNEPGASALRGWWPLDDAEPQAALREPVEGNEGHRTPYTLSTSSQGTEGTFERLLSGEGEALVLDLSENPVFGEEFRRALQSGRSGFAVQLTLRLPHAFYGIPRQTLDTGSAATSRWRAAFAPTLVSWEPKDPVAGLALPPAPLLQLGHSIELTGLAAGSPTDWVGPFSGPLAFDARFSQQSDDEASALAVPLGLEAFSESAGTLTRRYGEGTWVGDTITVQVGVEPTQTAEVFRAYIAWSPKRALFPEDGDTPGAEFAYYDTVTIDRRLLERTVLTIGGVWNPSRLSSLEANARVLVDSVRWFGATASGALPASSGAELAAGLGKIGGAEALPKGELEPGDLIRRLPAVQLTDGSPLVLAATGQAFDTRAPQDALAAIDRTFLTVEGESETVAKRETLPEEFARFYLVESISASTATLANPYRGTSRRAVGAASFRMVGYTALAGDLADLSLPLGRGAGFTINGTTVEDVALSPPAFENLAPPGGSWRLRLYTPFSGGEGRDRAPSWTRGFKASHRNPILGAHALGPRRFMLAQGALFEVDDRWRHDGPLPSQDWSLAFLASEDRASGVPLPRARDRAVQDFSDTHSNLVIDNGLCYDQDSNAESGAIFDAWVKLAGFGRYQTALWCGTTPTAPQWATRFDRGVPELVIGSSDDTTATAAPPVDGLFVARAQTRIPVGEWRHVRWLLPVDDTDFLPPVCFVNGRPVPVALSAIGAAASTDAWLAKSTVNPATRLLVLGATLGTQPVAAQLEAFTAPRSLAKITEPSPRLVGWLHSLEGQLSGVAVARYTLAGAFDPTAAFNPRATLYGGLVEARHAWLVDQTGTQYGIGHKLWDSARNVYATIVSHPFLSLAHDLGRDAVRPDFEDFNGEVYVAFGKRVRVIDASSVRKAGILPPQVAPDFEVQRQPLWKPNVFAAAGAAGNDPLPQQVSTTAAQQAYHQNNPGTSFVSLPYNVAMKWERDDFFAFKCFIRPRSVSGRIPLYSSRGSINSGGPFVEIRDGRLVVGWYDTALKREVSVETSTAVVRPGFTHYVYVRKWFPRGGVPAPSDRGSMSSSASNWQNSLWIDDFNNGSDQARAHDMVVVRRFPRAAQGTAFDDWTGFDAKAAAIYPGSTVAAWATNGSSARACVSFTSRDQLATGLSGSSVVTVTGVVAVLSTPTAVTTDTITIGGSGNETFLLDHLGMLCQLTEGNREGEVFRIVEILSNVQIRVVAQSGAPSLVVGDIASGNLVIATGVNLVKSEGFDDSREPDASEYPIEVLGSALAADPLAGVSRFDGEAWGFAFGVFRGEDFATTGSLLGTPDIFENGGTKLAAGTINSASDIGTDRFCDTSGTPASSPIDLPYAGESAGNLAVDTSSAYMAVDTRTYGATGIQASSQPTGTTLALARTGGATAAADPTWGDILPVGDLQGVRRAAMTFYDPVRGIESALSPLLVISPASEEPNNPSRGLAVLFRNLPTHLEGARQIVRRFYLSEPDSLSLFLVGTLEDPEADTFPVKVDELVLPGDVPADPTRSAPPRARVLGQHEGRMFYGHLDGQPDGIAFSLSQEPELVLNDPDLPSVFALEAGQSEEITGLRMHGQELLAFKRDSIIGLSFAGLAIRQRTISEGDGCVSPQAIVSLEERLYVASDRGVLILIFDEIGRSKPFYVGKNAARAWIDQADPRELENVSGGLNRGRNQVHFAFQARGRLWTDRRLVVEFDHPSAGPAQTDQMIAGHRFAIHEGPNATALTAARSDRDCPCALIAGTEEGFAVWLDRGDTHTVLPGPNEAGFGNYQLEYDGSELFARPVGSSNVTDYELEGPRGVVLRWADTEGVEREAVVVYGFAVAARARLLLQGADGLFSAGVWPDGAVLPIGTVVSLGALRVAWRSAWIDIAAPDLGKEPIYLFISHRPEAGGRATVDVFRDLSETPVEIGETLELDLTEPYHKLCLNKHLPQGTRSFSFRIRLAAPMVDRGFELFDLVVGWDLTAND